MRDRQPTPGREGRVKIVGPYGDVVAGTLQMDDDPLDEGTPFNKSTMLKDATAALYGLGVDAVPDDELAKLAEAAFVEDGAVTDIDGNIVGPQIATGSYVGTGTSGSSSRNTLTFSFEPKIVFIQHQTDASFNKNSTSEINYAFMINGITSYVDRYSSGNVGDGIVYVSWEGNTVTWYRDSSSYPDGQLNISGATYHYVAIG